MNLNLAIRSPGAKVAPAFFVSKFKFYDERGITMSNYKFETLQLHVGQEQPDPATDARAVPI